MPKRREFLKGAIAGTSVGLLGGITINNQSTSSIEKNQKSPPNIIIFIVDDLRWNCLGIMGDRIIQTPHIDKLALEGILFYNHFVTTSICCTSRASILTGKYARKHQIWDFEQPLSQQQFNQSYPFLLKKSGYQTAFIGKWGLGGKLPVSQFDYWQGFEGQGQYFASNRREHLTQFLTNQALEFIRNYGSKQPFCLSLSYKAPHAQDGALEPFQPDPKWAKLYENVTLTNISTNTEADFQKLPSFLQNSEARKRWQNRFKTEADFQHSVKQYYRLITGIDDSIGQIIQVLKQNHIYQQTCLIFTSDNGFFLGDRGLAGKWYGYEESIRVPLIIRLNNSPTRQLINAMTLNIDLAPTILEMAQVKIPESMQGVSLMPLISNQTNQLRDSWFYEHLYKNPQINIPQSEGIRTQNYKYLNYLLPDNQNYEMLFNLQQDPLEENNLISDSNYQEKLALFRQQVVTFKETLA